MYHHAILRTHIHRAAQHVPGWWIGSRPLSMEVVSVKGTSIMFEWDEYYLRFPFIVFPNILS